uniref:Uncharacterized protein n=1 Tax=Romanomermis culicivorax TaxID=13658 RepID=A0A915JHT1_ROMCU
MVPNVFVLQEKQEDLERNKQLAQEFSYEADLNDNSKPKITVLDDSSDGKSKTSDDFRKKRNKHYDNEYAAALRKAKKGAEDVRVGTDYNVKRVIQIHKLDQWFKGTFSYWPANL